ncbi:hypothetical protein [Ramlibacter rhizophilus]|uniref:3-deoxy-D-arabino-heptulosonate 7-phosphate synthase n=1 Tax=Ramlibacter rhizophilus TaxID=1781167 RepID=A0A4Z0BP38_9BURK|nr:hypothetical protein [Ramlibacter rhizophilus]TFZ01077.1 hypothetical protein EZ242_06690 [Ramlibacter rhizophilus]
MPAPAPTDPDAALLAALRAAPRRTRLPSLPADPQAAGRAAPDLALATAIEIQRASLAASQPAPAWAAPLFVGALAALVETALAPVGGDPAFQALLLRRQAPVLDEFLALHAQLRADQRRVRTELDRFAHPAKHDALAATGLATALAHAHQCARAGDWAALRDALAALHPLADPPLRHALDALAQSPALARLERLQALQAHATVRRLQALHAARGPLAGTDAAAAQGRASARVGRQAEAEVAEVFDAMAEVLNGHAATGTTWRAVRGLRLPAGFPGVLSGAKDEWDIALVVFAHDAARVALLGEVKASPAAAVPDLPRLLSGLRRLALAQPGMRYRFASEHGPIDLPGEALRALRPRGGALPERVVYCCNAPPEAQPPPLSAAARALLLGEAETLEFALRHADAGRADPAPLQSLWEGLASRPRLRPVLQQFETARIVRDAMLRPQDLLDTVRERL